MYRLTDEQRLLVDSTRRFLNQGNRVPVGDGDYWRRGADLGWTALLANEASPTRFTDLALLAREFGRSIAAGPLGPVNVVVGALSRNAGADTAAVLDRVIAGDAVAAWVDGHSCWDADGHGIAATPVRGGIALDGVVSPVEAVTEAEHLLISARDGTTVLLPARHPGISIEPLESLDRFRMFGQVQLTAVTAPRGSVVAGPDTDLVDRLRDLAVLVQLAEIVGALEWALETTVRWTFDRYSFGRPLAAYQAIQHRAADLRMWLEACRAITADVAEAFDRDAPDRSELVSAAKSYVARQAPEALHECVQFHGGIGVTAEHDLHLYLRRVAASAATHGTASDHAARLGVIVETRESST
jgi:alkylation response protein AidB-like acyl-CoA dehydrogenase